jgi:pSer/pThr/pTyr-binding forkhead associated (FHA) protein
VRSALVTGSDSGIGKATAVRFAQQGLDLHVTYNRDEAGAQRIFELEEATAPVTIGRRPDNDVAFPWDAEVSRVHAQLERVGREWSLRDDGISRNGSYVNGERLDRRRRLRDGDRLCFGETPVLFRAPHEAESLSTAVVGSGRREVPLSEVERKVLVALCRPLSDSAYAAPATNREIADEVHLSVDSVKAHLRVIFDRLDLGDLPQNQKRASLAALALVNGLVRQYDF